MDSISTNHWFYWLTLPLRNRRKRKMLKYLELEFDLIVNTLFPMDLIVADLKIHKIFMCYEPYAFFYDSSFLKNFTIPQQLFFKLMRLLFENSDKMAVEKMDEILTINKTNIPKIRAVYKRDAIAVYAGIDSKVYFRSSTENIKQLRGIHTGQPLLFHSSDLTATKATYQLLEILKLLTSDFPNIKLLITVYVDLPNDINRLKSKIIDLGLEANVEYLGCLPKESLPLYYSSVDFVCQPSINQPASWPLKESLLCGTPIIGGWQSEEIDEHNGVKINAFNIEESRMKLIDLFAKKASDFSIDAEELKKSFSIDACLNQFNKIVINYENNKA